MGGGGKGGNTQTTVEIDPRLEELGVTTGVGALKTAALPFKPQRGVQIAAFTPQQLAGMEAASAASSALGLSTGSMANLPRPEVNAMGIAGYDPSYSYDEMIGKTFTPEDLAERDAIRQYYSDKATEIDNMPAEFRNSGGGGKK